MFVEEIGYGSIVEEQGRDGRLQELSYRNVILLKVLGDSGLILSQELSDCNIEEFRDSDVICVKEAGGGRAEILGYGSIALQEFRDRDVVVLEEFRHGDIIRSKEARDGLVKEFGHGHVVIGLGEELRHGDVVLEELGHCGVQILAQGLLHELGHGDVVGAARPMQELRDSNVIGLVEEFGAGDAVGVEELRYGGIEVVRQVDAVSLMVGRENLVEELGDGDIVAGQVLGHGNAVFGVAEELGHRNVVGGEELGHDVVEEFGDGDVVLLQERGK